MALQQGLAELREGGGQGQDSWQSKVPEARMNRSC